MKLVFILSLLIAVSACGKKSTHTVDSLPNGTKNQIQESLRNKHIPSRQEVADANIQFDDACEEFRKTIPKDWFQGLMEVPEDPAAPEGTQIKVFYYGKIKENVIPIVFFNGGPTEDSHSSSRALTKSSPVSDPKGLTSFVYIDQRGNGCSDYYPQGSEEEVMTRLSHYGSRGIVADAEAVRKKLLNDKPWIAFGQSYGAFIAHKYSIIAGEGLKAAFAHASVITDDGFSRSLNRIRSQTRVLEEYFKVYPEDRHNLKIVNEQLTYNVCFKDDKSSMEVCGYETLSEIPIFLAFRTDWKSLHSWIVDMVDEDTMDKNVIGEFAAAFYFSQYRTDEKGVKITYNVKKMADKVIGWVDRDVAPLNIINCRKIRDSLLNESIDIGQNSTTECAYAMQLTEAGSDTQATVKFLVQDKLQVKDIKQALQAQPHLPLYLYSGELDQTVPKQNFEKEVAALNGLPNFHYTHFMKTGHDGYRTEQQVWDELIFEIVR